MVFRGLRECSAFHFISLPFPGVFLTKPLWFRHMHERDFLELDVNFLMRLTLERKTFWRCILDVLWTGIDVSGFHCISLALAV